MFSKWIVSQEKFLFTDFVPISPAGSLGLFSDDSCLNNRSVSPFKTLNCE